MLKHFLQVPPLIEPYPNLAAIANRKSNKLFPIIITGVATFSIGAIWPLLSDFPAPTDFLPPQNPSLITPRFIFRFSRFI
jgi:hypothetical protein